jgi:hypothetical protein
MTYLQYLISKRAHDVQREGFSELFMHSGRELPLVVTVFSAPNYCGYYGNLAAIMRYASQKKSCLPNRVEQGNERPKIVYTQFSSASPRTSIIANINVEDQITEVDDVDEEEIVQIRIWLRIKRLDLSRLKPLPPDSRPMAPRGKPYGLLVFLLTLIRLVWLAEKEKAKRAQAERMAI